jgi:hypothetical protein
LAGHERASPKDIALAYYSEAIHFIVTPWPYATTPIRGSVYGPTLHSFILLRFYQALTLL